MAVLAFLAAGFFYFVFLSSSTKFNDDQVILLVTEKNANKQFIKKEIKQNLHSTHYTSFLALAEWTGYWKNIKPGRYIIKNGMGVFTIFRKLHNGSQDPIKIIITKIRTRKDLADYLGKKLEATSNEFYRFMNSNDSLSSLGITKETVFTLVIPNTYEIYWNTNPRSFFNKMNKEANKFWNDRRLDNLQRLGLSRIMRCSFIMLYNYLIPKLSSAFLYFLALLKCSSAVAAKLCDPEKSAFAQKYK